MGAADSVDGLTRRYSKILRTVAHIDLKDDQFILAHRAMQTIYRLGKCHTAGACRDDSDCASRSARPASSVFRDRLGRAISFRQSFVRKRAKAGDPSDVSSMKVELSLIQSSTPSSRGPPQFDGLVARYQGVDLDPFPPIVARSDHDPSAYIHPPPHDGIESHASSAQFPTLDSRKQAFDQKLRRADWLLAEEFPDTPARLRWPHGGKLNNGRITALTIDDLMRRRKSPASNRGVIVNVNGAIQFFRDNMSGSNPDGNTLTGEASAALSRGYLESVSDRGRTVPGDVKTSLITWSEAPGVPWPLATPLVCADAQVESSETPKHDPPMKLDTVKKLEAMALNVEISPFKRVRIWNPFKDLRELALL